MEPTNTVGRGLLKEKGILEFHIAQPPKAARMIK